MSKSKQQGRQGKKKKAAAPKVAAHAPAIASKKAKAVVLTKKQLIQQEKAARKRNNNNNNNNGKQKREDLTSLFGPINSNTMAAEKRANYKNHIQSKKGSSNSSNSGASKNGSNNNNNNKSNRNNNYNYHDNKHRTVSIDLDGVPLHHKHSYSRDQSSSKNNNYKGKNQKKRAPPPTAPPAAATFELQSVQNSKNCKVPWWRHEHIQAWKQSSNTKESSLQGVPGVPCCSPKRNQQNASNNKSHYLFRDTPCPITSTTTTTTTTGEWLSQLTAELESFAHYVQVNDTECAARNFMVSNIQHLSRHSLQLQQIDGGDRDQIRVHVFGSYATKPVCAFCSDVDMALFGVVPVPEGDDDDNDDDLTATATARGQHIRFGDHPPQEEQSNKSIKKKDTLVQKWRDAFAEFDQSFAEEEPEEAEAETTTTIPTTAATKTAAAVAVATNMTVGAATAGCWQSALDQLLEGSNEGPDAVTKPRAYSDVSQQTVATETTATSEVTATTSNIHNPNRDINKKGDNIIHDRKEDDNDDDDEVQVIMQVVDLTNNASDEERAATTAKSMNAAKRDDTSQVFADAKGDMHMPTDFFVVDRLGLQDKKEDEIEDDGETSSNNEVVVVGVKQAPQEQQGKEKRVPTGSRKRPLPTTKEEDSACGSDSEDDTSDKLDSLLARKQQSKQTRPSSSNSQTTVRGKQNQEQAIVSLSSSDDDNDEKGDERKDEEEEEEEWNDLQVSFVSKPASINKKAVVGPQGLVRVKVVNALNNLGNILQRRQYTENVRVIRKARVPIVKFQTKLGFEGDVAVGGHTGTDTSQFAMSQVARFKSFAPVVMALKILLWQHNLDAPFTGGLGSYKLYVLVAHHLERHMEMGGEDCPGEVFISFLIRFGKVKRGLGIAGSGRFSEIDGRCSTSLNTQTILQTQDGYEADMSAVFLVQHCVELFRRCWSKLAQRHISSTTNISKSNNNSSNGNTTPRSILVDLYDLEKLKEDRTRSLEKASLLERYDKSSKSNKSSNAGSNNGRIYENSAKRRKMQ